MRDDAVLTMAQTYAAVFTTILGRAVLEDLRLRYGDRQSFVVGDPHATSYHEGQRSVYLLLTRQLEYARDPATRRVVVEEEA